MLVNAFVFFPLLFESDWVMPIRSVFPRALGSGLKMVFGVFLWLFWKSVVFVVFSTLLLSLYYRLSMSLGTPLRRVVVF